MASKLEISKLDKKQSIMLGIIAAMVIVAGSYLLYYDPSQKKITEMRNAVEAKDKEIKNARMHVALFKPLKKQVAKLEEQLDKLKSKLATRAEIISLIKTVEEEAQRLNLKVINMSTTVQEPPPPPTEGEAPANVPVSAYSKIVLYITLQGKYNKLEGFQEILQNLETFLVVEELNMSSDVEIYPDLTASMELNLYLEKGVDNNVAAK
ncbi:MAG: type 4a pilus biogenesis protein PilO [Candidatus Scalindua sp.]